MLLLLVSQAINSNSNIGVQHVGLVVYTCVSCMHWHTLCHISEPPDALTWLLSAVKWETFVNVPHRAADWQRLHIVYDDRSPGPTGSRFRRWRARITAVAVVVSSGVCCLSLSELAPDS